MHLNRSLGHFEQLKLTNACVTVRHVQRVTLLSSDWSVAVIYSSLIIICREF